MNNLSIELLLFLLFLLHLLSAFFSGSETAMLSLNRHRLRHLSKQGKLSAQITNRLLQRPDRLISTLLIGNNFINIFASSVATIIATRLYGDAGIAIATAMLTFTILIFGEITPKTLAIQMPDKIALPASLFISPLLVILYPIVSLINFVVNRVLLWPFSINMSKTSSNENISVEEIRTMVVESTNLIPQHHRNMLLGIIDLEKITVNDVMVPRNLIVGIDLNDDHQSIRQFLLSTSHTKLLIYEDKIDNLLGVINVKNMMEFLTSPEADKTVLLKQMEEAHFIPENTPLYTQLNHFQRENYLMAIVVDEYGSIQGILTVKDILEEVIHDVHKLSENSDNFRREKGEPGYFMDSGLSIRDVNKALNWSLPTDGPKTLNGLITETLEILPVNNLCLQINNYRIEVVSIAHGHIRQVHIWKVHRNQSAK